MGRKLKLEHAALAAAFRLQERTVAMGREGRGHRLEARFRLQPKGRLGIGIKCLNREEFVVARFR
jgi:hypothetical protein